MSNSIDLTVILPAYNEEAGLPKTLPGLIEACRAKGWKIIVVNDFSTDKTAEVLKEFADHIRILSNDANMGYGASLKRGIRAADTQYAASFDADGQHRIEDLEAMAAQVEDYDAVVGKRTADSHVVISRVPGKWVLSKVADILVGHKIPDINCGLRIFKRDSVLPLLHLASDRFSFSTSLLIALLKTGLHVRFVDVVTSQRVGKSTVKQLTDGYNVILLILRLTMLFDPLRVLLPVSAGFLGLGAVYQVYSFARYGFDINDLTVLLVITGLIFFLLALIADQLSSLRRELCLNKIADSKCDDD